MFILSFFIQHKIRNVWIFQIFTTLDIHSISHKVIFLFCCNSKTNNRRHLKCTPILCLFYNFLCAYSMFIIILLIICWFKLIVITYKVGFIIWSYKYTCSYINRYPTNIKLITFAAAACHSCCRRAPHILFLRRQFCWLNHNYSALCRHHDPTMRTYMPGPAAHHN